MEIEEVVATPTVDIANEVPADDNPEEANASQTEEQSEEQTDASQASKGSRSFTKEERATIIELAKEVGATKVAREIGVSASLIYYWLHQEKKKSSAKSEQSSEQSVAQTAKRTHTEQPTEQTQAIKRGARRKKEVVLKNTPTEATEPEATEPVKSVEPTEAKKTTEPKVPKAPKAQKTVSINALKSSEQRDETQALIIENAILKEKISTLTAEIEKLKAAMTSLM